MPDPTPILSTDTGILAGGAAGLATMGAVLYRVYRAVKSDKQADARVAAKDDLVEHLQNIIEKQTKRIDELTARVDAMAKERNEALVENGRLKAELHSIERDVERVTKALTEAQKEISYLKRHHKKDEDDDSAGSV